MKEKMLSTAASRSIKSPVKTASGTSISLPKQSVKTRSETDTSATRGRDERREDRQIVSSWLIVVECQNQNFISSNQFYRVRRSHWPAGM